MTLLSNAKLKAFAKLHDKKYRDEEGLFLAEGNRAVAEILARPNAADILTALVVRNGRSFEFSANFVNKTFTLPESEFNRLANTDAPQDVIAVCRQPVWLLSDVLNARASKKKSLAVLLNGLQDAGNVGTIVRTAAWFGADMILANADTADFFNPKAVRSSAGSLFAVPLIRSRQFLQDTALLKQRGYIICASALDGEAVTTKTLPAKLGLVIGNEGRGVSDGVLKASDKRLAISGDASAVESLNAAVAAGIFMSMYRQAHSY
ncbi:MAG: hypothetical protein HY22_06190 [[Candidatus Thermochlorobacteriaceae] bacterium GBChlB]|nr:MAG: hypothetical protein HY22_06190 [[Candidatus Thermochlorobacteriaceae] bacterium GBChlB]